MKHFIKLLFLFVASMALIGVVEWKLYPGYWALESRVYVLFIFAVLAIIYGIIQLTKETKE